MDSIDKEEWRAVPFEGFCEAYQVSDKGNVKGCGKNLRQRIGGKGYPMITMSYKGKVKVITVHRLVALAFIPNDEPQKYNIVHHKNEIKQDNRKENLCWTDSRGNMTAGNRIIKLQQTRDKHRKARPLIAFKYIDGEVSDLRQFASMAEASRVLGIVAASIENSCKGYQITAGGYIFHYI